VLADLDAVDVGVDRLELAAELAGRVRLEVEGVLVARPPGRKIMITALCDRFDPAGGFGAEQLRQREAAHAERADAEEVAARNAVAESGLARRTS
jgi:hypothetical protein